MAVISLEFSSVLTCPKVSMLPFDKLRRGPQALTRWIARSTAARPWGTAHRPFSYAQDRPAVDGHHLAGHEGRHRPGPINETLLELPRVQPGKTRRRECRGEGMPWGRSRKVRNHSSLPLPDIST